MQLEKLNPKSFWYFISILQLTILKCYLNLLDSKETTKEQITNSLTLVNYFCFWLSIFPFLWFICKLPNSTNRSILSANLPGFDPLSNELSWETLVTSSDYNQKLFNSLKDIEINSNSFLLNHENLNNSIQTLLSFQSENTFQNLTTDFKPRVSTFDSVLSKLYDLDEIPLKLESTLKISNQNELEVILNKLSISSTDFISKKTTGFLNDDQTKILTKKESDEKQNLKITLSKEKNKLKLFKTQKVRSRLSKTLTEKINENKKIQNWLNFSVANEILSKYSRTSFIQLSTLNNDVELNEKPYFPPRFFSGYNYPDMGQNDVWNLVISSKFNKKQKTLTISYYPKAIYFSNFESNNFLPKENSFVSPFYEIGQNQHDDGSFMFISHDSTTKDVTVKNRLLTQKSFLEKLGSNNFQSLKPFYFFANLNKNDLEQLVKNSTLNFENSEKQLVNINNPILQTISFFSVTDPILTTEEIKNVYHQTAIDPTSNLISISDFRKNNFSFFSNTFDNKNSKLFFIKENLNTDLIKKLPTFLINYSNGLISNQTSRLDYSPNLYKREIGSYWKTKIDQTEEFVTLNDSINSTSIFSISLLGFLISTFLILKTAYADYAKEFSSYLLDLISSGKGLSLDPSTIEWLNQELGLEEKKGGIRIFPKRFSKKRFTDIAGIKKLLPELSELVWFLRNKGRKFTITPLTSKNVLLVGPPGTGKTLLVQALAAEAEVSVVAQSTSILSSMNQDLTPGDAIRMAFQKARSLAPCILFLDELDSLGFKRDSLLSSNPQSSIGINHQEIHSAPFFKKTTSKALEVNEINEQSSDNKGDYLTNQLRINITNDLNSKKQQEREQVAALTQLLIEIDGVQTTAGILVIGATNRSNVLDPALIRPGRFSKVISLPLPDKAKRMEIFKLHSTKLGSENNLQWEYLAQRTKGFSAGDLSMVANQSAISAILQNSKHTLETFENAITVLTTYPLENTKKVISKTDPYYLQREVYYKVAQTFYNYYENVEEKSSFIELSSRQPNPRHYQILGNVNNDKNRLRTRFQLENLLTSLVSGKVGELLMLLTFNQKTSLYWESDLAKNDFYEATKLIVIMMKDWYLYSTFFQQQKFVLMPTNQNEFEYKKNEEVFSLFEETVSYLEQQLTTCFNFSLTQSIVQKAQWKSDIIQEISNVDSLFAEWSRFHLPDPQETERNPEWVAPEEYYHNNDIQKFGLRHVKKIDSVLQNFEHVLSFSELELVERDRYVQEILLASFNKAFLILENNREVLDTLACFLIKNKILRSFELETLIKKVQ